MQEKWIKLTAFPENKNRLILNQNMFKLDSQKEFTVPYKALIDQNTVYPFEFPAQQQHLQSPQIYLIAGLTPENDEEKIRLLASVFQSQGGKTGNDYFLLHQTLNQLHIPVGLFIEKAPKKVTKPFSRHLEDWILTLAQNCHPLIDFFLNRQYPLRLLADYHSLLDQQDFEIRNLLKEITLNANELENFLDIADGIRIRQKKNLSILIQEIFNEISESGMTNKNKKNALIQISLKKRYPYWTEKKKRIGELIKPFQKTAGLSIQYPEYCEGHQIGIHLNINSQEDLNRSLKILESHQKEIHKLLKEIEE